MDFFSLLDRLRRSRKFEGFGDNHRSLTAKGAFMAKIIDPRGRLMTVVSSLVAMSYLSIPRSYLPPRRCRSYAARPLLIVRYRPIAVNRTLPPDRRRSYATARLSAFLRSAPSNRFLRPIVRGRAPSFGRSQSSVRQRCPIRSSFLVVRNR